jgi:hypothetical protein
VKKEIGLWIDRRQAVIVTLLEKTEDIKQVTSDVENSHHSGGSSEDNHDNRIEGQLSKYYDEVITHLTNADFIFIMGPGEAKGELQKQLQTQKASDYIVAVKTADKMSDEQIVAAVREHFQNVQDSAERKS